MDSRGSTIHTHTHKSILLSEEIFFFFFTKVLSSLVLVDVYVDFFDGLQSLGQLGPVRVVLWCGTQKLHQQKWVAHHPLNRLD